MVRVSSGTSPASEYDAFLSAAIAEQENGTPVSVLSALTRANYDPWKIAAGLAELPPDRAEWALVEMLSHLSEPGRSWAQSEDLAKQLVRLLPSSASPVLAPARAERSTDGARLVVFWVMWAGFLLLLSIAQPNSRAHDEHAKQTAEVSEKQPLKSLGAGETGYLAVKRSNARSSETASPDGE